MRQITVTIKCLAAHISVMDVGELNEILPEMDSLVLLPSKNKDLNLLFLNLNLRSESTLFGRH